MKVFGCLRTFSEIRGTDSERARGIQTEIAEQFEAAFARDLAVIGVERDDHWFTYLLGEAPAGARL